MEASFWSGFVLDNLLFKYINIKTYPEFIVVCVITTAIALAFEGSRTVKDWLYLAFLKKRRCYLTSNEAPIILQDVKPICHNTENGDGEGNKGEHISNEKASNGKNNENGSSNINGSSVKTVVVPVIGTGTIRGSGEDCRKPSFHVGLLELSLSTLLHMCQVVIGYILMLLVMTFNIWIFLAVLIGTSIGFFTFDSFNRKIHAVKLNTAKA